MFRTPTTVSRRFVGSVVSTAARKKSSTASPSATTPSLRSLLWQGVFTIGWSAGCFGLVSISKYHELRGHQLILWSSAPDWALQAWRKLDNIDPSLPLLGPLIAANVGVWVCWQAFPYSEMMKRLFLHTPGSGRALPMLLSTFSHVGIVHLGFNMAGLWSFGGAVSQQIGYSQMLAVYLSSGVATSFFSACFSVLSRRPVFPSLGASGGILALASTFGFLYPDAQFYLLFYPLATFPAQKVLAGTVLFDLVGLVGGWTMFDHAAHLGGIGLGAAFIHFKGYKCVAMYQSQIYRWYDDFYQKVIDDEKDKKTCFLLRPKDEKTHFQWKPKS